MHSLEAERTMSSMGPSLRVLVTGASGYLGQFLLDEILRRNGTVSGRTIKAAGTYSSRPDSIPDGAEAIHMNLQDPTSVEKCLSAFNPDVVINLAALSSPAACEKSKDEAEALNSPVCLLDSLQKTNAGALLIHISTDQIFDGNAPVYTEASPAVPVNTYGATKLLFEENVKGRWANHVDMTTGEEEIQETASDLVSGPRFLFLSEM